MGFYLPPCDGDPVLRASNDLAHHGGGAHGLSLHWLSWWSTSTSTYNIQHCLHNFHHILQGGSWRSHRKRSKSFWTTTLSMSITSLTRESWWWWWRLSMHLSCKYSSFPQQSFNVFQVYLRILLLWAFKYCHICWTGDIRCVNNYYFMKDIIIIITVSSTSSH